MTYHLRGIGTTPDASTPEAARWYKLTPSVVAFLRSAYPTDAAVRNTVALSSPAFVGFTADDLYYLNSQTTGNVGGGHVEPIGEPVMTYAQVLKVFEVSTGGPTTKPVAIAPPPAVVYEAPRVRAAPLTVPRALTPAAPTSSKLGLYLGIAAGMVAAVGGGFWAFKHFKKAAS